MTNTKTTRRALFASVISMLLCVTMLVGSTFAWFTDTASIGVNKIQAGTLDIDFMMQTDEGWVDAEGKTLNFTDVNGNADILWEPGATFKLPAIKVVNNGNLALKFYLVISGVYGDLELADVLDVLIKAGDTYVEVGTLSELMADPDGAAHGVILPVGETLPEGADKAVTVCESAIYEIALRMQETAGNKYQGMSLNNMAFTAFASQYTYENDMTDDQYDVNAEYVQGQNVIELVAEGYTKVTNYDELKAAITAGENVVLAADITTSGNSGELVVSQNADVTLDLNGYTITHEQSTAGSYVWLIHVSGDAKLTVNDSALIGGITANVNSESGQCFALIWNEGTLVINGGYMDFNYTGNAWGYVVDNRRCEWGTTYASETTFTLNGGVIDAGSGEDAIRVADQGDLKLSCKKNAFTMTGGTVIGYSAVFVQQVDNTYEALIVNIEGGTLDVSNYLFRAYSGEKYNGTGYTLKDNAGTIAGNALVTRITIGKDVILCGDGAGIYYISTPKTATMISVPANIEMIAK